MVKSVNIGQSAAKFLSYIYANYYLCIEYLFIYYKIMYIRKFSDEDLRKIVNMYAEQKLAINKIARIFHAGDRTIAKVLHSFNVVRPVGKNCLYKCDESFFKTIDSESKAYWLGVMFADGNVSYNSSGTGQMYVSSIDKNWIEQFKESIHYTGNLHKETHRHYHKDIWKMHITNNVLFHDLCEKGCVPRKSKIIQFPNIVSSLVHHFIRGYFDGDGFVSIHKYLPGKENTTLNSGVCSGSKEFLEKLIQYIPAKHNVIKHYSTVYTVTYGVKDSYNLYNYMYSNATIYLERKKEKFEKYAKERRSTTIISPSL